MPKQKNEMEEVLDEIKLFYKNWLSASNMTEDNFLEFRKCDHFRVILQNRIDGFAVQLSHGKEQSPIGLPFFVGFKNNDSEKEQYFVNTPLLLMYMASQLDKKNKENPINGSYGPDFFKDKVRKICPKIIEKGSEMLDSD